MQVSQRLYFRRFASHRREGTLEYREFGVRAGNGGKRENPTAVMADMGVPLARCFAVHIVMDMQDDRSTVDFRQGVDDGDISFQRKRERRAKNANRVGGGNQSCHLNPDASCMRDQHPKLPVCGGKRTTIQGSKKPRPVPLSEVRRLRPPGENQIRYSHGQMIR